MAEQPSEPMRFKAWANDKGYDTAHTYDTERSRWVFFNPMTADLWESWRAALSQPSTEQGWISVDERLPKPFEDVLIYPRPTDYCCEGQVDCKGQWSYAEYVPHFGQETHRIRPTHWAPIPPPPIEPREEKL